MARIIQNADLTEATPLSPDEKSWIYNALDCCVTHEVHSVLVPQLDDTTTFTYELELALRAPILDMTMRGLLVDQERRGKVLTTFREEETRLRDQLNRITSEGIGFGQINPLSPDQLKELLYDCMGLPVQRARNTHGRFVPTTGRAALEKLQEYFLAQPVVSHILAIRDLRKKIGFLSTGIDPDGRIRASFNIAGTSTGRLASSMSEYGTGTNLQNVSEKLRSVVIADPGMKFANFDLEQADSRNIGAVAWNSFHASHGEAFAGSYLDACESGDLHTVVTRMSRPELPWPADLAGLRAIADQIAYRDMSYRDLAKRLGHGSNYLLTARSAAVKTKIEVRAAEEFQQRYFSAFPCIKEVHNATPDELPVITTFLGRRRAFFGRPSDPETIRRAVAYKGQSPTADEINTGMVQLWRANLCQLLVQVHDSLLVQFPEELESELVPKIKELLTVHLTLARGRPFHVPVEAKTGWNWGNYSSDNPDGLMKFRGNDDRTRQYRRRPLWKL